jgi:hypothetical protein
MSSQFRRFLPESHCQMPPEPGFARREAHNGEENTWITPSTGGS